jgi:tRNA pseudouridine38-40 synthase
VVEYDGSEYLGFQIQRSGRTVQGELERALSQVTGRALRVVGAGRTDSGVHARGQVIHFTPIWSHTVADLQRALNAVLSRDVAIRQLQTAEGGFHARYSARSREYVYTIYDGAVRSPLQDRYSYHSDKVLDEREMNSACQCLVGEHDFAVFGWAPGDDRSIGSRGTVREVFRSQCRRDGSLVYFEIEADAFLRRMVRRIVGNLLLVGAGDLTTREFVALLDRRDRRTPGVAAPGRGLCLARVNY